MRQFPLFFVIVDVISFLLWKGIAKVGSAITTFGGGIEVKIGSINIFGWLSGLLSGLGKGIALLAIPCKIVFFVSVVITVVLIIMFIVSKIKYRKMMKKVDSLPSAAQTQSMISEVAQSNVVPANGSTGPTRLNGF